MENGKMEDHLVALRLNPHGGMRYVNSASQVHILASYMELRWCQPCKCPDTASCVADKHELKLKE